MKIKCEFFMTIPDSEIEGMTEAQRRSHIDKRVGDEFRAVSVYSRWEPIRGYQSDTDHGG